jgi:hypothetical protein
MADLCLTQHFEIGKNLGMLPGFLARGMRGHWGC